MTIPHRSRRARLALALGLGMATIAAAGCGAGSSQIADADLEAGRQMFNTCQGCHTLADAGSTGSNPVGPDGQRNAQAGPNLDDAFRASRQAGMSEEQFAGVIMRWIRIAQPPMPRDLVTGEDAVNVAAYIASVAGRDDESDVRRAAPDFVEESPQPPRQDLYDKEAPAAP